MISLRHPPREVLLEVSVPKEDTVHKEQRHLSHALWGNTVEPKEIRNLMTALPVILGRYLRVLHFALEQPDPGSMCSRAEKSDAKNARGLGKEGNVLLSRSRGYYFRFSCFIFATFVLTESLAQVSFMETWQQEIK